MFPLSEKYYRDQQLKNIEFEINCLKEIEEYRKNLKKENDAISKEYCFNFFKKGNDCIELVEFKKLEKK